MLFEKIIPQNFFFSFIFINSKICKKCFFKKIDKIHNHLTKKKKVFFFQSIIVNLEINVEDYEYN